MVPPHIYDAIFSSPVGKLINRLIIEEHARCGDTSTPDGYGSIIDQLYETILNAQNKYRRDRAKGARQTKLHKYQTIAQAQKSND
jgi:hypothetical protein